MESHAVSDFGMYSCLRSLAARGYFPECVLDIGAAMGEWTGMALQFWPSARFVLFEPLEERRTALEELRRKHNNVDYILSGVADVPGRLSIGISENLYISSFAYPGDQNRYVEVVTIDQMRMERRFPQPQFLKLDVQGYEFKALAGASETMRDCDLILLELQFFRFAPDMLVMDEAIRWMAERNFFPYEFVDFLRRPHDGAMGQCDLLFLRGGHWLGSSNKW